MAKFELAYAIRRLPEPRFPSWLIPFGTGTIEHDKLEAAVRKVFDLTPAAIIRDLDLRRPIYRQLVLTATWAARSWGVKWENTDRVEALKAAVAEL